MVKNLPANAGDARDTGLIPGLGRSPGVGNSNPIFLPGKFHGQRSLTGYSPWDCKESDMTEHVCTLYAAWYKVLHISKVKRCMD